MMIGFLFFAFLSLSVVSSMMFAFLPYGNYDTSLFATVCFVTSHVGTEPCFGFGDLMTEIGGVLHLRYRTGNGIVSLVHFVTKWFGFQG